MNLLLNPMPLTIALVIGAILVISLLWRRNSPLSNRLLCVWMLCNLFVYFVTIFLGDNFGPGARWLVRSRFPTSLLGSATLYLYVSSMTCPRFTIGRKQLVHFLPFTFGLVWYAGFLMLSDDARMWTFSESLLLERYFRSLVNVPVLGFYLAASFSRLRAYKLELGPNPAPEDRARVTWLTFLLRLVSIWLAFGVIDVLSGPNIMIWPYAVHCIALFMVAIAIFALRQSPVFHSPVAIDPSQPGGAILGRLQQAKPSPFSDGDLTRYKAELMACMDTKKMYLDPQLRLASIAEVLGLKVHETSELINRSLGLSFYDLVNSYRVEEAKRRLVDAQYAHMNVLGIASDCGFNSKSSFNEIFKRATGVTPTAFRENTKNPD